MLCERGDCTLPSATRTLDRIITPCLGAEPFLLVRGPASGRTMAAKRGSVPRAQEVPWVDPGRGPSLPSHGPCRPSLAPPPSAKSIPCRIRSLTAPARQVGLPSWSTLTHAEGGEPCGGAGSGASEKSGSCVYERASVLLDGPKWAFSSDSRPRSISSRSELISGPVGNKQKMGFSGSRRQL